MNIGLELMKKDAVAIHQKTKLQRGQTTWGAPETKNPFDFEKILINVTKSKTTLLNVFLKVKDLEASQIDILNNFLY